MVVGYEGKMTISPRTTAAAIVLILALGFVHAWLQAGGIGLFLFAAMVAVFAVPATAAFALLAVYRRVNKPSTSRGSRRC